jgi:PepSY-associated TM region
LARLLKLAHRYLGIAVGVLMVLWCLSGMVMMYVPYPQLTEDERVQHLQPIDWSRCCTVDGPAVSSFQVEMLDRVPILRVTRKTRPVDLSTGRPISAVSPEAVAANYALSGAPHLVGQVYYDQWTVQGGHGPDRPLSHFELNDNRGTELYVSSVTGKAVQQTTARQRFWNWLGSVPHWLYFTTLRANGELWSQVVIWTSLLGSFLTVTGIYVGLKQLQRRSSGRWIPYRGFHYWHHAIGLAFGLFVLTWVGSGLISMNPWGFLEGDGFDEPARLRGAPLSMSKVGASLNALAHSSLRADVVQVESAALDGTPFMVVTRKDGSRVRFDEQANPTPLQAGELRWMAMSLAAPIQNYSLERLEQEDEYYFSHHREHARLPVYRLILPDRGHTRYYIDPVSGDILKKVDRDNQWYRWLHQAPHRFDFSALARSRPLWDVLTLLLLSGTTVVCAIGAYLGLRRLAG